jgi:hypothetical protein
VRSPGFRACTSYLKVDTLTREIIVLCVRWYLRLKLSFRDLVEMMAKRGLVGQVAGVAQVVPVMLCSGPAGPHCRLPGG